MSIHPLILEKLGRNEEDLPITGEYFHELDRAGYYADRITPRAVLFGAHLAVREEVDLKFLDVRDAYQAYTELYNTLHS